MADHSTPLDWLRACASWYRRNALLPEFTREASLRRCVRCGRTTYRLPEACTSCGAATVGWDLASVASGADGRLVRYWLEAERRRATAHRSRTAVWVGAGFACLVLLVLGGQRLIFVPVVLFAAALAQAAIVRWVRRAIQAAGPPPEAGPRGFTPQDHDLADRVVMPFLDRCAGQAAESDSESIDYHPTWDLRRSVPVSRAEATMLQRTLAARGLPFGVAGPVPRAALVSATLLVDRRFFRGQVEAACARGASAISTYAQCAGPDDRWLPFLEEQLPPGMSVEAARRAVAQERERLRQLQFEGDLAARQGGVGRNLRLEDVDLLTGQAFQRLLALVFEAQGYRIEPTPLSRDQGADVLAERGGERLVLQAKHRGALDATSVGNKAVQEVVAARSHYRATHAAVITNHAEFTAPAQALARSNAVELWGRDRLAQLLETFNRLPKDYTRLSAILADVRGADDLTAEPPEGD